jgi:hypothetical protein
MPLDLIGRSKHFVIDSAPSLPCPNSSGQKPRSANMALKLYPCECGRRFQLSESEDTTKCLTCRIVDDLKAGRVQPPAAIRSRRGSDRAC